VVLLENSQKGRDGVPKKARCTDTGCKANRAHHMGKKNPTRGVLSRRLAWVPPAKRKCLGKTSQESLRLGPQDGGGWGKATGKTRESRLIKGNGEMRIQ